jgi:small subunit ribosomal protein S1
MAAEYDDQGNYIYPEGFDVETGDWQEGFEAQREAWEKEYAEAHTRYEQHIAQIRKAAEVDVEPSEGAGAGGGAAATNYSSQGTAAPAETGGSLASDEQLAALREKLSGGA